MIRGLEDLTPRGVGLGSIVSNSRDEIRVVWRLGRLGPFHCIAKDGKGRTKHRLGMSLGGGIDLLDLDWTRSWRFDRVPLNVRFPLRVLEVEHSPSQLSDGPVPDAIVLAQGGLNPEFRAPCLVLGPGHGNSWTAEEVAHVTHEFTDTGATSAALNYPRICADEMRILFGVLAGLLRAVDVGWVLLGPGGDPDCVTVNLSQPLSVEGAELLRRYILSHGLFRAEGVYEEIPTPLLELSSGTASDYDFMMWIGRHGEKVRATGWFDSTHFEVRCDGQELNVPYFATIHASQDTSGTWSILPGRLEQQRDNLGRFAIL